MLARLVDYINRFIKENTVVVVVMMIMMMMVLVVMITLLWMMMIHNTVVKYYSSFRSILGLLEKFQRKLLGGKAMAH